MEPRALLQLMCQEGESHRSLWPFPLCPITARMQLINMKCFFSPSTIFHFPNNSSETRTLTSRVLLRFPRPPSAAAVSHCRVSALAAWRTSRCWRPSWGPIPTVTSCMWWTPAPRSAHCETQPYSMFLYFQVGFMFSSCAVSASCAYNKIPANTPTLCDCGIM